MHPCDVGEGDLAVAPVDDLVKGRPLLVDEPDHDLAGRTTVWSARPEAVSASSSRAALRSTSGMQLR